MALVESGVNLVAKGYSAYITQLQNIAKAQKEAFKEVPTATNYKKAADEAAKANKSLGVTNKELLDSLNRLKQGYDSTSTGLRQYKTNVDTAWSVTEQFRRGAEQSSTSTSRFKSALADVRGHISNFGSNIVQGVVGLKDFGSSLLNMIPGFLKWTALLGTVMKVWQFFKASGDIAQRNETLRVTLVEMGQAAGYSMEQIDAATESLRQQGITTQAAQQSLIRMSRANISWAEASKLAAIAQGSAVAAGMNSSEAFERLILGVQKMEPELLDELGITLQRSQAYKAFAAELGVSETALNQQQKQQAILNEIYRQSQAVLGVYDAAMETSGKQQGSLARHIEETQASLGKLMLPFKELSIAMQTDFWKGMRLISKGLESWVPIIRAVINAFQNLGPIAKLILGLVNPMYAAASASKESYGSMGESIHTWARVVVQAGVLVMSIWDTLTEGSSALKKALMSDLYDIAKAFYDASTGNWGSALVTINKIMAGQLAITHGEAGEELAENFMKRYAQAQKNFPDVFKDWNELIKDTKTDIDLNPKVKVNETLAGLEEQKALLEQQIPVYEKIQEALDSYNERVQDINKNFEEQQADAIADLAKAEEDLAKRTEKQKSKIAEDGAKQRQKLIDEHSKRIVADQKKRNQELERERDRFLMSQKHAYEKFQLDDRRLRAEGDVLALMQLRENYELEKKHAKEGFNQGQEQRKEDNAAQAREQQQELQERLSELDNNIKERQQELQTSYLEELEQLRQNNAEKQAELRANYEEQLMEAKENRDKQLEQLGKSLQDEANITEEGMQGIYEKMREVMGEDGPANALMKGFQDRTKEGFEGMVNSMKEQLNELEASIKKTEQSMSNAAAGTGTTGFTDAGFTPSGSAGVGMREGGAGIVRGPASFHVEPGQREAVMFAPLPTLNRSSLDVNMRGNLSVTGTEGAGRAANEAALNTIVEDFRKAVTKLGRRR